MGEGGPAVGHMGALGAEDQPRFQLRVVMGVPCFTLYVLRFTLYALRFTLNPLRFTRWS